MAKVKKAEYQEAIDQLRKWLPPGSTCYTVLESVSRSGMSRQIRTVIPYSVHEYRDDAGRWQELPREADGTVYTVGDTDRQVRCRVDHLHPNHSVGLVTGYRLAKRGKGDGLIVGGCGMDMGFALVYELSSRLYGGERCDCGRWYLRRPAQHEIPALGKWEYWHAMTGDWKPYLQGATRLDTRPAEAVTDGGGEYFYQYIANCPKCKGSGNVIGTGYQCLGKGRCPSSYHSNHRDRVRCEGTRVHNPNGPDHGQFCYKPGGAFFSRHEVPEGWPMRKIPIGDGEMIDRPAACLTWEAGEAIPVGTKDLIMAEDGSARKICPTCKGEGDLPNPAGPERFDLEHFDGYAVSQRWL